MDTNEKLKILRDEIDVVDSKMAPLFVERMGLSKKVAKVKGMGNLAIVDDVREQQVVSQAVALAGDEFKGEMELLMRAILAISKEKQRKSLFSDELGMLPPPRKPRRTDLTCVFQGVPGAWSEQALIKLFPDAARKAVAEFEDVFLAVKNKKADYGVVPIENSKTGAIGETYDLLRKYGCFIVGRTWLNIQHCLLAPEGTELEDVREVFSHPEGFRQCSAFLRNRAWDLTACRNTAVAAQTAASTRGGRTAAIGSRLAGELNGLKVLAPDIMDVSNNSTSFVVISTEPEYDETDDLISVTFSAPHRSGALCEILLPFMSGGMNLLRIESRPVTPGEYRFFVEVQGNILDDHTVEVLRHASVTCEYFEVIGCYKNTL
ncbi:MAG: chorismate mutase [Clostridiales Family XIII bacterium]|jgi:chorismate mutase/prephenate dehydratase|nr:chorismate mutase [Clostridiales Family XIII bacterium]